MTARLCRIAHSVLMALVAANASAGIFAPVAMTPHPAVCRIAVEERGGQAFGSGTLIDTRDQYGLVITNWHVVRDATGKIEVRFPSGYVSEARPLKLDETWDLAALVVWRPPTEPARLATRPPQPGDQLTICGYGQGEYLAQSGRCTEYFSPAVGQPQELVELNVEARQGDSGGPIFNDRGELAGVLFGAARGTTLGSFGGRVQTFLASLAPDIGTQRPSMLAAAPGLDPFLNAERQSSAVGHAPPTAPRESAPPQFAALTTLPRPAVEPPPIAEPSVFDGVSTPLPSFPPLTISPPPQSSPPQSLTDRTSAPRLAVSHHSADAWTPTPPKEGGWFAPPTAVTSPPRPASLAPSIAANPTTTAAAAAATLDWFEDGRTLLALVGVAALVVTGLRTLG